MLNAYGFNEVAFNEAGGVISPPAPTLPHYPLVGWNGKRFVIINTLANPVTDQQPTTRAYVDARTGTGPTGYTGPTGPTGVTGYTGTSATIIPIPSVADLKIYAPGGGFTFTITADSIVLWNGSTALPKLGDKSTPAVSLTVDVSTSGANGLDSGSLATAWYLVYVIGKADGTLAGLVSVDGGSVTMPTGYTFKKLVGCILTDGAPFYVHGCQQMGDLVYHTPPFPNGPYSNSTYAGNARTLQVPPSATAAIIWGIIINSGATVDRSLFVSLDGGLTETSLGYQSPSGKSAATAVIPLHVAQTGYFRTNDASGSYYVTVVGFVMPI